MTTTTNLKTAKQIEKALNFKLFAASMGKIFRVTAICSNIADANAVMERHKDWALISEDKESGLLFIAEQYGHKIPSETLKKLYA